MKLAELTKEEAYTYYTYGIIVYAIERTNGEKGDEWALLNGKAYYMDLERNGELNTKETFVEFIEDCEKSMAEYDLFITDQQNLWRTAKDQAVMILEKAADNTKYDFEYLMEVYEDTMEDEDVIKAAEHVAAVAYEGDF